MKFKKIRLNLVAMTRQEYTKTIMVPVGMPDSEIDTIMNNQFEDTDVGDFIEDPDYFEKGHCWWEEEKQKPKTQET